MKLFLPENFTLLDLKQIEFGKKKHDNYVPLFHVLKVLKRQNGSKILTHFYLKSGVATGTEHRTLINVFDKTTQSEIYQELAYRFVRRYKILVAFSYLLEDCLHYRYRVQHRVNLDLPKHNWSAGWLLAKQKNHIRATVDSFDNKYAPDIALYRMREIEKMIERKRQPTGVLLVQWVLQLELFKLIKVKENEQFRQNFKEKQLRIRGQQSYCAEMQ
jgi:hypothetical protein